MDPAGTLGLQTLRFVAPVERELGARDVDRVLQTPLLEQVDERVFPPTQSLRSLIAREARIVNFQPGDIIVRDGDYGSSVFIVLAGTVRVLLDRAGNRQITASRKPDRRSLYSALAQHWRRSRVAEERRQAQRDQRGATKVRWHGEQARTSLKSYARFIERFPTTTLEAGEMFGEIAALTRSPRTATVLADSHVELVEIRWQGVRTLRQRDTGFRAALEALYRSRDLSNHLKESPLFRRLDEETIRTLAEQASFESYGELEWFRPYKQLREGQAADLIAHEPLIAEEGHYVDGLLIIRNGFARVSKQVDHGHWTEGFVSANQVFGLEELVRHWRDGQELRHHSSLRAVGYVDVLRIPTNLVEEHVLPRLSSRVLPPPQPEDPRPPWSGRPPSGELEQTLLDALVDGRIINGQAAMMIDTDRCVSCDDCVAACATTHGNNPRFTRTGPTHNNLLFAHACMHCVDPVCLVGCPTGAIYRSQGDVHVLIDEDTCIGCGTCADACPYDNIILVETRDSKGRLLLDEESGRSLIKATKCDLCVDQYGGPACQRACPYDALRRVDLKQSSRLARWISARGRRFGAVGWAGLAMLGSTALVGVDLLWERSLGRHGLFSGWVLGCLIAILLLFGVRKKLAGLPLASASWWLRGHLAVGALAAVMLFQHTGWLLPNGLFETVVWTLSLAVLASGLGGVLLARWVPPRLSRYGDRVLFEHIPGRIRRLAEQVEQLVLSSTLETASASIVEYYTSRLARYFAAPRNTLAHLLESSRTFHRLGEELDHLSRFLDPRGKEILEEIRGHVGAKRSLDYRFALNLAMRLWRFFHVPVSVILTAAVLLHLVLVLAFASGS